MQLLTKSLFAAVAGLMIVSSAALAGPADDAIKGRQQTGYHRELYFHYFCTIEGTGNLKTIHHLLKTGGMYDRDAGALSSP